MLYVLVPDRPASKRYSVAVAVAAIALVVNWIGWRFFSDSYLVVPTAAALFTLIYGGIGPAVLVIVSTYSSTELFLIHHSDGFIGGIAFRMALISVHSIVAGTLWNEWKKSEIAKRNVEAALKARDQFMTIASHEFRTPLTAMKMHIDMMEKRCSDEATLKRIQVLKKQALRMEDLISNLLDVSRIVTNRLEIDVDDVNLSEVVSDIMVRHQELFHRSSCDVSMDLDPRLVGSWDRMRLEQVLLNLISNACKYGSGKPIRVRTWGDYEYAFFSIQDNGIGIAQEDQRRIFEQFERAVSVKNYGGLGLGLWITNQIVKASGGDISVDSQPNKGSTFTIRLPRYRGIVTKKPKEEDPRKLCEGCELKETPCPSSDTPQISKM